jgi:hypothetical protein
MQYSAIDFGAREIEKAVEVGKNTRADDVLLLQL